MGNTVSNVSSSSGGNQSYGINVSGANLIQSGLFGISPIDIWDKSGEGIFSGVEGGEDVNLTSRSVVKVLDLLGEGEIEGLVSGEYIPYGSNNYIGRLGYENVKFEHYSSGTSEGFLRSVYLNEVPVVNIHNQYNFQKLELSAFNGAPEGLRVGDKFLNVGSSNNTEKSRIINENLYGPDTGGSADNPWLYHPKTYRLFNKYLKKIRVNIKVSSLVYIKTIEKFPIEDVGKTVGTSVNFKLRFRPLYTDDTARGSDRGWYPSVPISHTIKGLTRSAYIYEAEIDVYDQNLLNNTKITTEKLNGWEVEITRTTPNSIESNVSNETFVESVTEISDNALSYPNSAMVSLNFDAEYFSQIPNRSYDVRLLKVKLPVGYDPITRQYSSEWNGDFQKNGDGTFKKQWTDNPVWIFYDLLTNKRYGVGKFIEEVNIDKWTLYEISKYCDVLVSNGEGDVEPRFSCNTLITTKEDAHKVIQDFASCFRSIVYYGFGSLQAVQDKPRKEIAQFTNSNVEEGDFSYTSSSKKSRPTVCLVRYNDKKNFYKPAIEYVEDADGIKRFGVLEKEITAFACTSKSQAIRLGRWILSTESAQAEMIHFVAGPEGLLLRPGDVIRVADENRALEHYGGRIVNYAPINNNTNGNISGVTLDKDLLLSSNKNYTLFLTTPSFFYDTSLVDGITSNHIKDIRKSHIQSFVFSPSSSAININKVQIRESINGAESGTQINYNDAANPMFENSVNSGSIIDNAVWTLIDNDYSNNQYVITSIKEQENFKYDIEGVIYEPLKYEFIESGISYSTSPVFSSTVLAVPPAPDGLGLSLAYYSGSTSTRQINISITPPTNIGSTHGYKIFAKKGSAFNSGDTVSTTSSLPKEEFYFQTVFLSDRLSGDSNLQIFYVPSKNNETYYFRVFAINSSSILSNDYKDNNQIVTDHFPIRDVEINSLRLQTDNNDTNPSSTTLYRQITSKDAAIKWETSLFGGGIVYVPLTYKVRIHPANTNSSDLLLSENVIQTFLTTDKFFNYTFNLNAASSNGPRRNFIITVEAIDEEGESSSNSFTKSTGWDLMEIDNPKPINYFLTPRKDQGKRPGDSISCENVTTEQYITADGLIKLGLRNNAFTDIAGVYIYLSKFPFSGEDFLNGRPKNLIDRTNIYDNLTEEEKIGAGDSSITGQYNIIEIPFEASKDSVLSPEITVNPTTILKNSKFNFNYSNSYYMAAKFYDSFDREIKNTQSPEKWENEYKNLHIGFARDNVSGTSTDLNAPIYKSKYSFGKNIIGDYIGDYTQGTPSCVKGTFSCPIYPTKYFSAGAENGFRYWIRINVNGQWEGNGISHIKILNAKDVKDVYNYNGFYEYSCVSADRPYSGADIEGAASYHTTPNNSFTKCRFRQGQTVNKYVSTSTALDSVTFGYYTAGGVVIWDKLTTGITRSGPETYRTYSPSIRYRRGDIVYAGEGNGNRSYLYFYCLKDMPLSGTIPSLSSVTYWFQFSPTLKAGIGYGGWGVSGYDIPSNIMYNKGQPDMDKIDSYNEAGILISGKSRPLRGFRRYRVYFDENNLPPKSKENGLASYSIVGINSWNGSYESWPITTGVQTFNINYSLYKSSPELERSLIFAKDGSDAFARSAISWLKSGDLFENIPGVWNHHPAGFGAGFGGLKKTDRYFDVHLGRLIDDSYLNEAFFGVISTNDYTISETTAWLPSGFDNQFLHEASWQDSKGFVTLPLIEGGDGVI